MRTPIFLLLVVAFCAACVPSPSKDLQLYFPPGATGEFFLIYDNELYDRKVFAEKPVKLEFNQTRIQYVPKGYFGGSIDYNMIQFYYGTPDQRKPLRLINSRRSKNIPDSIGILSTSSMAQFFKTDDGVMHDFRDGYVGIVVDTVKNRSLHDANIRDLYPD